MPELHPSEVEQLRKLIEQEALCIQDTKDKIEEISEALFNREDGIVAWAKDHIESEKERRELMKEIRAKLAVRGAVAAVAFLCYLLWIGFKAYFATGGKG